MQPETVLKKALLAFEYQTADENETDRLFRDMASRLNFHFPKNRAIEPYEKDISPSKAALVMADMEMARLNIFPSNIEHLISTIMFLIAFAHLDHPDSLLREAEERGEAIASQDSFHAEELSL